MKPSGLVVCLMRPPGEGIKANSRRRLREEAPRRRRRARHEGPAHCKRRRRGVGVARVALLAAHRDRRRHVEVERS